MITNILILTAISFSSGGLAHILIMFLVALIAILILAGLIWAVENWIIGGPLPNPVRMVLGLILIIILIILVLNNFGSM